MCAWFEIIDVAEPPPPPELDPTGVALVCVTVTANEM